jgi:membrane associated rhomboid family serine protease
MSLKYEKPEEELVPQTPEEFLRERKRSIRHRSYWAVGIGLGLVLAHIIPAVLTGHSLLIIFRSILFVIGLLVFIGGLWGLYEANRLTLEDFIPSAEAVRFAQRGGAVTPYFSYIIVACLVGILLVQMANGIDRSVAVAGLVKPAVWENGQLWRLITGATLHAGILHIYFNCQALYGIGSMIEYLSNRAHLAIVFLLAIVCGSLMSLFLMPHETSVGASGGIMGLIGYLAVYGYRRKQQLPPGFLRSMLLNIGFIAAFGIIAYQFVDNAAHLGGLLAGAAYGFIQVPKDLRDDPREANLLTVSFGYAALGIFISFAVLSVLLVSRIIIL